MKQLFQRIKLKFKKLPMQKKMMYSFTVPAVLSCILVNLICIPIIFRNYEEQLRYSVNQSSLQAQNYIQNYVENMYYISELLIYNTSIHEILASNEFDSNQRIDNQYREYYNLNKIFSDIEQANSGYRLGIYIPDTLVYSNNEYYFYPNSSLQERADIESMDNMFEDGKIYFGMEEERTAANPTLTEFYIALFRKSYVTAKDGTIRSFIWKVEFPLKNVETVLQNASVTPNSLMYLLGNKEKDILAVSNTEHRNKIEEIQIPFQTVSPWEICRIDEKKYYVVSQEIEKYDWRVLGLIPVNEFHSQSKFIWLITLIMTLSISGAISFIAYKLSRYYTRRLGVLNDKMKSLESGDFNTEFIGELEHSADEMDAIYENFNYMVEELRRLMKEHYRLGKNVMSSELKALQAQINPHFLYNTLDLMNWGAMDYGATEVAQIARNLGQFYRISLNKGKSAITIEDELRHVESYVSIENAHFEGKIDLKILVDQEIRKYSCLNIILQPFVENSIMHGIAEHSDITECHILITGYIEDATIYLSVEDDGKGIPKEQIASILETECVGMEKGYGVRNINFRLKLCYGDKYGVAYETEKRKGTKVTVKIPALSYEELETLLS